MWEVINKFYSGSLKTTSKLLDILGGKLGKHYCKGIDLRVISKTATRVVETIQWERQRAQLVLFVVIGFMSYLCVFST